MSIDSSEFRRAFLQEASEHASRLEKDLLALEEEPLNAALLNSVFRAAHSIKGAAGTLGFRQVADFTHVIEGILDSMRERLLAVTTDRISLLLRATDDLRRLIDAVESGDQVAPETAPLLAQLAVLSNEPDNAAVAAATARRPDATTNTAEREPDGGATPAGTKTDPEQARDAASRRIRLAIRPSTGFFATGLDPIVFFRDLAKLGQIERVDCDRSRVPRLTELTVDQCFLSWTVTLTTDAPDSDIQDVFSFISDECQVTVSTDMATPGSQRQSPAQPSTTRLHQREASTLRVTSDKVDAIIDLVGELVIAQSMVMQLIGAASVAQTPTLRDAIGSMSRNMQELQERVMSIRMVPVSTLFGRFSRVVHDTAASLGKTVHLTIEGQDTEIDKAVIEHLADPITHLVRNAIDHGLETDELRARLGKSEPATLRLQAQHVAGGIVIEVSDNGQGLDSARIRAKAEQLGLVSPADSLTDEQIQALIFEPGFSTARSLSDLSGRGVGLDVVRRCVDSLNGTIGIVTQPGEGTTFQIRLPLTLAILDGLLLRVGDQTYVLPLLSVVESFRPKKNAVRTIAGGGGAVAVRDAWVPLFDLGVTFGISDTPRPPDAALVVIVEADGKRVGLVVDCLVGQSQVVVKSIETNYRKVDGLLGATILGDGHVAFILDIGGVVRLAWSRPSVVKTRAA